MTPPHWLAACGGRKAVGSRGHGPASRRQRYWLLAAAWVGLLVPVAGQAAVSVEVRGVDGALQENVRNHVGEPSSDESLAVRRFAGGLDRRVREALQALGHYDPEIDVTTSRDGDDWQVVIDVAPGKPVMVREVDVRIRGEAADDSAFRELREELPLATDEPLHHGRYESSKSAIRNLAVTRGYFDGGFETAQIRVNPDAREAVIVLHYDSGPRYQLGDVTYSDETLSQDLLRRLVPFDPETPYHADRVAALNRNLLDSDYFEDVRVRARPEDAQEQRIPVEANVSMNAPNRVSTGLGFATDVGPRVRLNWEKPWVNARGHTFDSSAEASAVRQSLSGTYSMPLNPPLDTELQFQGGLRREDIEDTETDKVTLAVQRQRRLGGGWSQTLFLRWERERFVQAGESGDSTLTLPGMSLTRTRSRGGLNPDWGDRQNATVEATHPELGSDIQLARLRLGTKWLRTYGRHRVIARADAGGVASESFSQTPPSLRFFTGGDQSIRGFSYQSIAPENEDGELLGGRYLLVGGLEYGYRVLDNWTLATFYDTGDAFTDDGPEFKEGAGFGVRWASPVGPVRLDFAWGISEPDPPFRLHFSMGPEI